MPLAFCGPLGIAANVEARNASNMGALVGNSAVKTVCAAAVAAASFEALAGTALGTR
jgi:hypothetical protein